MVRKTMILAALVLGALTALALGAITVLYFAHSGDYEVPATTADDPSLPAIELDGYRFHAQTFGDPRNQTVLVLHGGPGGDYRSILPLADLADEYHVVFYDQRGAGLSPRVSAEQLTVDRYIEDVHLFVREFSPVSPVALIGHSWGAMLASLYIGTHPENVAKAVLAEPGFLDHEHMQIYNERTGMANLRPSRAVMASMTAAWAESLHVDGPDDQARSDYLMGRFFTTPIADHPLGGYYRDGDIANAAGESWRFGALAARAVPESGMDENGRLRDLAAGVDRWAGTALFIAGSENSIIGPDHQRSQTARFPRARLAVIEGAGHTMFGEKPEESLRVVREYLR